MREVTFWFGYNSPYSMLAHHRVEAMLAQSAVRIDYRPWFPGVRLPDPDSPKVRYVVEDVLRHAKAYGLRLHPGPYVDLARACRGFLFAKERGRGRAYNDAVHRSRWLDAEDISRPEILCRAAAACGLGPVEFASALESPDYAARMERETAAGVEAGVFGVPFFLFEGRKFWGNDRLEWLVRQTAAVGDD